MSNKSPYLSIVSPVYRAEKIVDNLVDRIKNSVSNISDHFEILLVEDGSPDQSWAAIERNSKKDARVRGIKLSKNFGQHAAITAGLANAKGEWVVVMDCDLQDRPEEIPNLYNKAKEGYHAVFARRVARQDSMVKKYFSKQFYNVLSYLTNTKQNAEIANFGIYNHKVIKSILSMGDYVRYFPTMTQWVGFQTTSIEVTHSEREEGNSSYNFGKLLRLALDIILSFSEKPLRIVVKLGLAVSTISFLFAIFLFFKAIKGEIEVAGYSSLIISIWLLSGMIITVLGIVGLYVGKAFEQVKSRPTFIIQEFLNQDSNTH